MTKCAVLHCKNYSNRSKDISYHPFPSDPERKREWVKAIRRDKSWIPSKHHKICSKHFEPQCYIDNSRLRKLNKDATPTLDLPGSITSNATTVSHCINCMYKTEVKTERLDESRSPSNSWTGDEDLPLNAKENKETGAITTIAIDPLSPKRGSNSPSDTEIKTKRYKKVNDNVLRKKLMKKEIACKAHVQKIYSLLKANRRLCQQNKNLKRTLMNMKKKIAVSGKRNGKKSDDDGDDDDDDEEEDEESSESES